MTLFRAFSALLGSAALILALAPEGRAEGEPAVPLVQEAPDGWDFTEGSWSGALKLDSFLKPGAFRIMGKNFSSDSGIKTELYLLRTADALLLGVICYDSDGKSRKGSDPAEQTGPMEGNRSGFPVGNRFEIYLDGDLRDRQAYYQMVVNPAGRVWVAKAGEEIASEAWVAEVKSDDDAWRARIRIPFREINIDPSQSESLHANFFRDYNPTAEGGERQFSTWQGAAIASFHSLRPLHLESAP